MLIAPRYVFPCIVDIRRGEIIEQRKEGQEDADEQQHALHARGEEARQGWYVQFA